MELQGVSTLGRLALAVLDRGSERLQDLKLSWSSSLVLPWQEDLEKLKCLRYLEDGVMLSVELHSQLYGPRK